MVGRSLRVRHSLGDVGLNRDDGAPVTVPGWESV